MVVASFYLIKDFLEIFFVCTKQTPSAARIVNEEVEANEAKNELNVLCYHLERKQKSFVHVPPALKKQEHGSSGDVTDCSDCPRPRSHSLPTVIVPPPPSYVGGSCQFGTLSKKKVIGVLLKASTLLVVRGFCPKIM